MTAVELYRLERKRAEKKLRRALESARQQFQAAFAETRAAKSARKNKNGHPKGRSIEVGKGRSGSTKRFRGKIATENLRYCHGCCTYHDASAFTADNISCDRRLARTRETQQRLRDRRKMAS